MQLRKLIKFLLIYRIVYVYFIFYLQIKYRKIGSFFKKNISVYMFMNAEILQVEK